MDNKIKFRAWHEKSKRWIYFVIGEMFSEEAIKVYTELCLDGVRFFQYTGFKDVNGKEIYEGDIVKILNSILKVEMTNNNHGDKYGFGLVNEIDQEYTVYYGTTRYDFEDSEIIGNIIETPYII